MALLDQLLSVGFAWPSRRIQQSSASRCCLHCVRPLQSLLASPVWELAQVVTNARTLKVETEQRGSGLAATGVHFTIKGPDGTVHEGESSA